MDSHQQMRRIDRFLIFRLVGVPMALALVAICRSGQAAPAGDFWLIYGVLGFYTLLAFVSLAAPAPLRAQRWFLACQVAADFAFSAALIWLTGGVESVFCPLLFTTLFNATTVIRGREALGFAGLSTAFLAFTTIGYQLGGSPAISPWPGRAFTVDHYGAAAHLVALGLALHAVALLGMRLSRGLRRMQNIQEEIIENMAEGLVAVDGEMKILKLNGEARRIFGLREDLATNGRPLAQVFAGESLQAVRDAFQGLERRRFEFTQSRPAGEVLPVEAKISCVADEEGRLRCRIGLFGDLSLKKEMEEAERRIHKLEELYDMAMAIAHEIRNPLASIRGCVQEIGRARAGDPRETKLVDIICRESDRLDRIIEEFMTNARRGPADLCRVDLVEVIEETVIQLRSHRQISARQILFDPPGGPAFISGDGQRLKQVFLNLGINAIEATSPERGTVRFSLRGQESMAMNRRRAGELRMVPGVEVEIADNGEGMESDVQKMAFTPFFTTKADGHGLGLAIVHRIVHDHFGKVDVESSPGQGTRFRTWFPLREAEPAPAVREMSVPAEVIHA